MYLKMEEEIEKDSREYEERFKKNKFWIDVILD